MDYLGCLFPLALISPIVLELYLSLRWEATYFQKGIPLFREKFCYVSEFKLEDYILKTEFRRQYLPSIDFKSLNSNEIAFREKVEFFRPLMITYIPIMRGIIHVDKQRRTVTVTGYTNWSVLFYAIIFVLGFVYFWFSLEIVPSDQFIFGWVLFMAIFFLGSSYALQYHIFSKIYQRIKQNYSRF
jgi:hypothetical protein